MNRLFIAPLLLLMFVSCTSESEKKLIEKINSVNYDFSNLIEDPLVKYNRKDGIQYGIITLKNNDEIKFWFLSHHMTSDNGGTIYKFPDRDQLFISGYHCCEVQFYGLEEELDNSNNFKNHLKNNDNKRP